MCAKFGADSELSLSFSFFVWAALIFKTVLQNVDLLFQHKIIAILSCSNNRNAEDTETEVLLWSLNCSFTLVVLPCGTEVRQMFQEVIALQHYHEVVLYCTIQVALV